MICRGSPLMSGVTPLAYDTAGGRLASMCIPSIEHTNATAMVEADYRYGYDFDDIGNRKTSAERGTNSVYMASQLNQYTAVDDFTPTYDADGNETLVKTATGIWQVTYNGENRPVRWTQGDTVITMSFDRMGRRVTKNDQRFVYNGYLQIANFRSTTTTSDYNYFVWDCTENVATRPLAWKRGTSVAYYTHDGNKNVSEVIASNNDVAAHYEYAPFGALTISRGASAAANPWRFSSEYAEDDTATVYYNYRHYEPVTGRWMSRDPIGWWGDAMLYAFLNNAFLGVDSLGLKCSQTDGANISSSASIGAYSGLGIELNFDMSGKMYDCCCDDGVKRRAWEIGGNLTVEGGLGIGSKVKLPYIGGVELLLKGPTISDTFSINFAKGCDDDEGCVEITAVDLKGNIGASFDIGVGFGGFISYYSSYEFKIVVRMCKSGYMKTFSKGWISGGAFGAHLGPIDLGGEFGLWDFASEFKPF